MQRIKQVERGKSFFFCPAPAWGVTAGATSALKGDQRRRGKESCMWYTAPREHPTALTYGVVKEMFTIPCIFIFLLKELHITGEGEEKQPS